MPCSLLKISNTFLGGGAFGDVYKAQAYGIHLLDPRNKSQEARTKRKELCKIAKTGEYISHVEKDVAVKTVKGWRDLKKYLSILLLPTIEILRQNSKYQ